MHREASDIYNRIEPLKKFTTVAQWKVAGGKIWDLNELFKKDGLHMEHAGYLIWKKAVEPYIPQN